MNLGSKFVVLGVILGTFATIVTFTEAGEVDDLKLDLADCKKVMARIAKKTLKAFGVCTKELKANVSGDNAMFQQKLGCAVKCTLHRMDIVSEDGKVTKEKVQKFMDEMVPQDAHEFGHELIKECNETYGEKLDASQENCESYSEYATCMQTTLADFADKTSCHPGGPH